MSNIKITAIQGIAGTSKTTTLAKIISKIPNGINFAGLSFTHHAVKNLLLKTKQFNPYIDSSKFKTIHSFFRIDYKNDFFVGSTKNDITYLFIDEFSMIDKELFKRIIYDAKTKNVKEIIIAGDFLQLPRAGTLNDYISIDTLKRMISEDNKFIISNEFLKPLQHYDNSCLVLSNKIIEKKIQYRNANNIFLKWILNEEFVKHFDELPFITFDECIKLLKNNYTLIASKYKILDIFKNELYENPAKGDFIYGTETINDIINGNVYVILNIENEIVLARDIETDELVFFKKPYNFYPLNLYTFHKSQGLTFENVIICIDDLFDYPMLYTGITRASKDIKFYSSKNKELRKQYLETHSGEKEIKISMEIFNKHCLSKITDEII